MGIVSAIIDSRDPEWMQRCTFGGVPTAVACLDAGDLLLACDDDATLLIENKSASDFLNTLRDDRLFPQLVRMREWMPTAWHYLALRGHLQPGAFGKCYCDSRETGWSWASVAGALLSIQEIGMMVYNIASDQDYEAAIVRLANRDRSAIRTRPAREATFVSEGEAVLCALPGIGPEKAQALLAYCGNPARALQYLTDDEWDGPTAPGVGEGTKRRIRKALELPDWAALALIVKETGNPVEAEKEGVV